MNVSLGWRRFPVSEESCSAATGSVLANWLRPSFGLEPDRKHAHRSSVRFCKYKMQNMLALQQHTFTCKGACVGGNNPTPLKMICSLIFLKWRFFFFQTVRFHLHGNSPCIKHSLCCFISLVSCRSISMTAEFHFPIACLPYFTLCLLCLHILTSLWGPLVCTLSNIHPSRYHLPTI